MEEILNKDIESGSVEGSRGRQLKGFKGFVGRHEKILSWFCLDIRQKNTDQEATKEIYYWPIFLLKDIPHDFNFSIFIAL